MDKTPKIQRQFKINPKLVLQLTCPLVFFVIITLQISKNVCLNSPPVAVYRRSSIVSLPLPKHDDDELHFSKQEQLSPLKSPPVAQYRRPSIVSTLPPPKYDDELHSPKQEQLSPSNSPPPVAQYRRPSIINDLPPPLPTHDVGLHSPKQEQLSPVEKPKCDLYTGEWVTNPDGPNYTNETCRVIQEHQNCMKYGRPDTEYMKWRWQPDGCDLPKFDPTRFLEIVTNKSLAFVGDSVARNQMQSLICLLSRVERPKDISDHPDDDEKFKEFKRYYYPTYNFTLAIYWSPYLVRTQENDPAGKAGKVFMGLFLDEADEAWTAHITQYNYLILSAGHWFDRPLIYREKTQFMGCRYCEMDGLAEYSVTYGYRSAFRSAFRAIYGNQDFKGKVFLRTFAPAHFEGGEWNHGGDCKRERPYRRNETNLEGDNMDRYMAQMEEFKAAQNLAQQRGLKVEVLDMTRLMLMRADGHPSVYGRPANLNVTWPSDCVHWCLPGPIDSWNDFLLETLRADETKTTEKIS